MITNPDDIGKPVETDNHQLVGLLGERILIQRPLHILTKREALLHAAWLVAMADEDNEFARILHAVQNT